MKKEILSNAFTAILVVCAVILTFIALKREYTKSDSTLKSQEYIEDWDKIFSVGALKADKENVVVIEFFDYECPFCKVANSNINKIKKEYSDEEVIFEYFHMPLEYHTYAFKAAIATECAKEQKKFGEYHNELFKYQESINDEIFEEIAVEIDMPDLQLFRNCAKSERVKEIVLNDKRIAESLGIKSIPTFIINGAVYEGAISANQMTKIIDKEISSVDD